MHKRKPIPKFKSEDEERTFWAKHNSTDYLDWSKAKPVRFPNLKATSRTISIRLPESLIEEIKILANKSDVPYQSMLKVLLANKVREETIARRGKGKAAQQTA
ncbi:MAG TPA: BrnA antitoxin family protein [Bacteroidota bacterium]|nr:BrnA antitoxin family protein [Bacteroidota bacterium]